MRASALVSCVALAVASVSHSDIYQWFDCDDDGSLLLTELDAEPFADLSGLYLGCADLLYAFLSGADLSGADLSGAFLIGADLSGADLSGAFLSSADLTGVDVSGADLSGANLSGVFNFIFPVSESTGSCCVSSGCTTNSESNCTELGGTWTEAALVTIVNQQPMIVLRMLMVTEPSGSPMSWSSSTIGACVRKNNILSSETSSASPFAYDIRMKIVSFVLGAVVLAPLGWTIGGLLGDRHCFHSRRAFRPADGVGASAATFLAV